jgi:GNAT superfamily N-acetyltransferase
LILEPTRSIGRMAVRPRSDGDLDGCVLLLEEVHRLDRYPTYWPGDPARWLSPGGLLGAWVAEEAGRIVGHVALAAVGPSHGTGIWSAATGVRPAGLASTTRLFVAPGRRRTGLGAALLHVASVAAAERALLPVLDVVETNREAIRLYERHGWRHVHSEPWADARDEELLLHYYVGPAADP